MDTAGSSHVARFKSLRNSIATMNGRERKWTHKQMHSFPFATDSTIALISIETHSICHPAAFVFGRKFLLCVSRRKWMAEKSSNEIWLSVSNICFHRRDNFSILMRNCLFMFDLRACRWSESIATTMCSGAMNVFLHYFVWTEVKSFFSLIPALQFLLFARDRRESRRKNVGQREEEQTRQYLCTLNW